jgi:lipopolysaccharide/colanic/teichoic acid biosynthesis glycosyltransferase
MATMPREAPPSLLRQKQTSAPGYQRPLDVVTALFALFITSPLWIVIALLVKLTSRGPVLFKQERIGLSGRPFTVFKFRTMEEGADPSIHQQYFKQYLEGQPAEGQDKTIFKLRRDPRITPVGGFLRRLGLDELPQLINVLSGSMAMVGPRPPLQYEVDHYSPDHWRRLDVKPGITGLWQVQGRDKVAFDSMMELDLQYVERQSLRLDLKIMTLTLPSLIWAYIRD